MPNPIPDTDATPPTPGELAMVDTGIDLVERSGLAVGPRLTWAGLHALPALAAMLDGLVDTLVAEGHAPVLLVATDTPTRAYLAIRTLDAHPDLAARLLAAGGPQ